MGKGQRQTGALQGAKDQLEEFEVPVETAVPGAPVVHPVAKGRRRLSARPSGRRRRDRHRSCWRGGMDHRADGVEITQAAALAAVLPAVGRVGARQRPVPFGLEEGAVHTAVQVVPGQHLVRLAWPQVAVQVDAQVGRGLLPPFQAVVLRPAVEAGAALPGGLEQVRKTPVPPGEHALEKGLLRIVPLELEPLGRQELLEPVDAPLRLGQAELPGPLEGGVRLGHKGGHAQVHLGRPAAALAGLLAGLARQLDDRLDILVGFRGQPDHEVELDQFPTERKGVPAGGEQVRLGDALVDDLAQPVGAGLRGHGEAGFPDPLDLLHDLRCQSSDAHGGHGHAHVGIAEAVHQLDHEPVQAGKIAGGQGQEGQFLETAGGDAGLGQLQDFIEGALAHRPVEHPRLAEPAPPGAAAGDLHPQPVVHRLDHRHQRPTQVRRLSQLWKYAPPYEAVVRPQRFDRLEPIALVAGRKQGRHVHALHRGQPVEHCRPGQPFRPGAEEQVGDLEDHLLTVAEHDGVEEVGHRLGVEGAGTAAQHERVGVVPVRGPERQSRQVEHGENVGVAEFVRQGDAEHVVAAQADPRLEGEERQPGAAQGRLHVDIRGVGAVRHHMLAGVEQVIEDLQPLVGHADLVEVGEDETEAEVVGRDPAAHGVEFAADILTRFAHQRKDGLEIELGVSGHGR